MIVFIISLFYYMGWHHYLDFQYVKLNLDEFRQYYQDHPFKVIGIFTAGYLFLTAFSIPGSIVLTILSGAIFGTFYGVVLVSLSGTVGATVAFLSSRYLLSDYLNKKYHRQFMRINRNLERDGILYLFTLRFIPVSPFVIINLVMGLTSLNLWTYIWTTLLGMIPGNWIYVYAGKKISELNSPADIMTPGFLLSLTLLGLLPLLMKKILKMHRKKVVHSSL